MSEKVPIDIVNFPHENINFLKKPLSSKDILAKCKLLKCGKTLAIGEVSLFSEGIDEPVAHAVGTYSIPPAKKSQ